MPSYNEKENIAFITQSIDEVLSHLKNKYDCVIVNCDNNSPDKTNYIFNNCNTVTKKESIVSSEIGKGINIINFFRYCEKNVIDYAFMFDSDLKSFESDWIYKMLNELESGIDFVMPLYKRNKFEGNSTNHFVVPILYAMYGHIIRQPIGGDYAFSKTYISLFNQQILPTEIKKYGIDIYMVILALNSNLSLSQVKLGYKIHGPSYYKMQSIFIEVANGMKCALSSLKYNSKHILWREERDFLSISDNDSFGFYKVARERYKEILLDCDEKNISKTWENMLINYLINFNEVSENDVYKMSKIFINYVFACWETFENKNAYECEKKVIDFSKRLRELYLQERKKLNVNNKR